MSAWDGSAYQEEAEREREARRRRCAQIARENPSLTPEEVQLVESCERMAPAAKAPRCCPCTTGRREIVRIGALLGRCECNCHGGAP